MPIQLKYFFAILVILISVSTAFAQQAPPRTAAPPPSGDEIRGEVVDAASGHVIEYASVVLYRTSDSSMVQGTVTDAEGEFMLSDVDEGRYYIEVRFMGYESRVINDLRLGEDDLDLGRIVLEATSIALEEVEVAADRAPVSYEIDKKVINVDGQLTAVDVLQNVPSVTVDLDGGVRLRGSGSFTLLIDGRPSALDASDALEQIPASAIENIEIITNPSARWDPEGVSGIINIIMKKGRTPGTTGTFNLNAGTQDRYGGDLLLTQRGEGFSVYFGGDYGKRGYHRTETERSRFASPEGDLLVNSSGDGIWAREGYDLRAGFELPFSMRDNLGAGIRYGYREHGGGTTRDYLEQRGNMPAESYLSRNDRSRGGNFLAADANYQHLFEGEKHELSAELSYRNREGEEETTDELLNTDGEITSGRHSTEDGPGERLELRVDYLRPMGRAAFLESGYQARVSSSEDRTTLSNFDTALQEYVLQPEFSRATTYDRNIHALYTLFRGEAGDFGYQAGLRGEYTGRQVEVSDTAATFDIDRWDYFPTLHASYSFSGTQQIMASYTRRIDRPRGWYLEPFLTWMDAYNVRIGNPDLQPEYIDSWEAGYQTHLGDNLISVEGYHRMTSNKIERVRSVYRDNVTLQRVENVGTETASGAELMFNFRAFELWDIYLLGNLYDYRVEGELSGRSFAEQRFTWNLRFNNTFRLSPTTMLQLNLRYNSPSVSAQGRTEGYAVADFAVRQEFFERRFSATLDVSDVFHTAERESTTFGPDFSTYQYWQRDYPVITLTLRYNLNPGKQEKEGQRRGGEEFDEEF
ncbi:MAG: outer membrane beta-barrel family protein [Bacteroidota bacterium]|nr:outer membrane beta-barrel family protein [Bacteroidota bacterium]